VACSCRARWGLLVAVAAASACGPTSVEVGETILIAAPLAHVAAIIGVVSLGYRWRLRPALGVFGAVFVGLVALAASSIPGANWNLIGFALLFVGPAYCNAALIGWRLGLAMLPRHAASISSVA